MNDDFDTPQTQSTNPPVSGDNATTTAAAAHEGPQVGDVFRFKRSNTEVKVYKVNESGTVDIIETHVQAKDSDRKPIPERTWMDVSVEQLEAL